MLIAYPPDVADKKPVISVLLDLWVFISGL